MSEPITTGRMFELTNLTFGQHFNYIIALAGVFIAFVTLISLVLEGLSDSSSLALPILLLCLLVVAYAKLAVMIHRLIVLHEKGLYYLFKWSTIELKFTGLLLAIAAFVMGFLWLVFEVIGDSTADDTSGSAVILLLVGMLALGYFFSRVALIFPATAVGHQLTLKAVWRLTSNNKLSLFVLVILVPYFTDRIIGLIPDHQLLWSLIGSVISVFVVIYEVGLISHCYESLTHKDSPEDSGSDVLQ